MENLFNLTDDSLLMLYLTGNKEALEVLCKRYSKYSLQLAYEIAKTFDKSGVSVDDLSSIGLESFYFGVKDYVYNDLSFYPYWRTIAKNNMLKYMEENAYTGEGNQFSGAFSLDDSLDENGGTYHDIITDSISDVVDGFSMDEVNKVYLRTLNIECSSLERFVWIEKFENGKTFSKVATLAKISPSKAKRCYSAAKEKLSIALKKFY